MTQQLTDFDDQINGGSIVGVGVDGVDGVFDRAEAQSPGNSNNDNNRHGFVSKTVELEHASFYGRLNNSD